MVIPEHVHLLLSEPEHGTLAEALKSLKQGVARRLIETAPLKPKDGLNGATIRHSPSEHFWQKRYYDFNVSNYSQFVEKLRYIHRNPVKRELCEGWKRSVAESNFRTQAKQQLEWPPASGMPIPSNSSRVT